MYRITFLDFYVYFVNLMMLLQVTKLNLEIVRALARGNDPISTILVITVSLISVSVSVYL